MFFHQLSIKKTPNCVFVHTYGHFFSFLLSKNDKVSQPTEAGFYSFPHVRFRVLFREIVIYSVLLHHISLFEEVHDFGVFTIELCFQVVELGNALVIKVASLVTLQQCHRHLIHRIVRAFFTFFHVTLQIVDKPLCSKVGALIKAFHFVARYFQAKIAIGYSV